LDDEPEINMYNSEVDKKCIKATSKEAQQILLNNLASKRLIPITSIYAPKQAESNCWFNTMFMVFFISDKGRKFFKFFRDLMIKGRQLNGKKVRRQLHNAFLHLDIYIDAVLSGESNFFNEEINTNVIIKKVYEGIPKSRHHGYLKNVGHAHNPLREYSGIMSYLGNDNLPYENIRVAGGLGPMNLQEVTQRQYLREGIEMIILQIFNQGDYSGTVRASPGDSGKMGPEWERKNVLEFPDGIVRDTKNRHFCCLMTYDNEECGFDGVSYRRLSKFEWKKYLNKDEEWTFEGSNWDDGSGQIKWNFRNGYQILFYYRIK
jgi:hypothetical protein